MMHQGRILFEVAGQAKAELTIEGLQKAFRQERGEDFADDWGILSTQ
jgi:ABC-type uncharacterized transport system ATPase component